jgi:hypothetical protein
MRRGRRGRLGDDCLETWALWLIIGMVRRRVMTGCEFSPVVLLACWSCLAPRVACAMESTPRAMPDARGTWLKTSVDKPRPFSPGDDRNRIL